MGSVGGRILIGLLLVTAAARAEPAACSVKKGLYDEWLGFARRAGGHRALKEALLHPAAGAPDPARRKEIEQEYQAYFRCLSGTSEKLDEKTAESFCDPAAADRLGLLVCRGVRYIKTGRTASKDFIDAFPASRTGAEMIWNLEEIAGAQEASPTGTVFQPHGPSIKLIDELFLLVLDDRDTAAAKYFTISATATGEDAKHIGEQIKMLLREAPAVVVKEWPVLRQYQSVLKKLLAEMAADLPKAEMIKTRQQIAGFCPKENLDCLEILKLFGRPD